MLEKAKRGIISEEEARRELVKGVRPVFLDSEIFRPICYVMKGEVDEEKCVPTFLEIDEFVRKIAEKYFVP